MPNFINQIKCPNKPNQKVERSFVTDLKKERKRNRVKKKARIN